MNHVDAPSVGLDPTGPDPVVFQARGVSKMYPGTVALDNVDFNIYLGKVNVLIGENGAGKSTLMKIVAGVEQATTGTLVLDGEEIVVRSPRDAARHGIGIIYQELNLFPNLDISENIFMARERLSPVGLVKHGEQRDVARQILERIDQPLDPDTLVADLRIGQQQIVEIAKALAQDTRILIMDEPTSALSQTEVDSLFRIIRELTEQGVSIVYISHKMDELLQIGDYFTVLRDGRLVAETNAENVSLGWIVEKMVGRNPDSLFSRTEHQIGGELLVVNDLTLPRPGGGLRLDHVSFTLREGEVLGIYGLMGAGRSEVLECLMGLHPRAQGRVELDGAQLRGDVAQRIGQGVALIPEDRQRMGLVQTMSVAKNVTLASLRSLLRGPALSDRRERREVQRLIDDLDVKVADPDQLITSLSGGNQQKVVVAKNLMTKPKVLLMDEPTRGIDVAAKGEIFTLMNDLANNGLGVLFVSSELKEIMAIADRVLVMSKGRITAEFARSELTEQRLVAASAKDRVQEEKGGVHVQS